MNTQHIDRYVAGRMSEAEAEAFETACVADPALARQVEFEQRLKSGLAQVVASGSTEEFVRSNDHPGWKWAAAASVMVGLLVSVLFVLQYPSGAPLLAAVTTSEQRQGTSLRLAQVRGAETTPHLPRGMVRVEIVGLFDPGSDYLVALDRLGEDQRISTLASLEKQLPNSPLTLEVMIDGRQLDSGSYFLRVRKQAPGEEALDFSFIKE